MDSAVALVQADAEPRPDSGAAWRELGAACEASRFLREPTMARRRLPVAFARGRAEAIDDRSPARAAKLAGALEGIDEEQGSTSTSPGTPPALSNAWRASGA